MSDNQTDKPVATIRIGLGLVPVFAANFCTDKEGNNSVVDAIAEMQNTIIKETMEKLNVVTALYCQKVGVEIESMSLEELEDHLLDDITSRRNRNTESGGDRNVDSSSAVGSTGSGEDDVSLYRTGKETLN